MRISDWSSDVCSSDLERLRAMRPGIRFVMPCASPERRLQLEQMLVTRDLPLTLLDGRSHEALAACNAVLIASGTATLEALLFKRPMVVAYSVAPMTYRILRWLEIGRAAYRERVCQ